MTITLTLTLTLLIVGLLYGVPASVRTFRGQMADDENVYIIVTCIGIMLFCWLTGA
jgi:hypothetical protein